MKKKIRRLVTAMMTLLMLAPSYSARAEVPTDLKIKGTFIKTDGSDYSDWGECNCTKKDGNGIFYFNVQFKDKDVDSRKVFKFKDNNGQEWGAGTVSDEKIIVETTYDLKQGDKAYKIDYYDELMFSITADFSGDVPKVRVNRGLNNFPTIEKPTFVPGEVPENFYILGNIQGKNGWNGDGTPMSYTERDEKAGTLKFKNVQIDGSFVFSSKYGSGDELKSDEAFWGGPTTGDKEFESGRNTLYNKSGKGYLPKPAGTYNITVYFPKDEAPFFTARYVKPYYFIGDLNDWFSTEFTDPQWHQGEYVEQGVKTVKPTYEKKQYDDGTVYYEISRNETATRYCMKNQGIDKNKRDAEKNNWRFEYIDDPEDPDYNKYNGWYRFSGFPESMLTGQFQIFDGTDWGGEVYSHAQPVTNDNDVNPHWDEYEAYYTAPITRMQIKNGCQLVKGTYNDTYDGEGKLTSRILNNWNDGDNAGMIRKSTGQNFHMDCNGVRNAVIYFKPGDDPKLVVTGDPVDFYVFYGLEPQAGGDEKEVDGAREQHVRAKMSEGKPNTNNYFLPGIWYTQTNENGRTPLPNYVGGNGNIEDHMNLNGIDLVKVKVAGATRDELVKVFNPQVDYEIIDGILGNNEAGQQVLPNGQSLEGYEYIWVTKIPNGFENPAGRKYSLQFEKAGDPSVKNYAYTLKLDHMYFFSNDPVHVHVDYSKCATFTYKDNDYKMVISYRVYKQDVHYNTVIANPADNSEESTKIYGRDDRILLTREAPEATRNLGWVLLNEHGVNCESWCGSNPQDHKHDLSSNEQTLWSVHNPNAGVAVYAEGETETSDVRHQIHQRFNQAYVQFKVETRSVVDDKLINTTYHPESLGSNTTGQKYTFGGKDLYVVMDNGDGLLTGIDDITIEQVDGEYSAEDAEPVYYNLQGLRVDNPAHGLFIRVRGNKSDKIYIR